MVVVFKSRGAPELVTVTVPVDVELFEMSSEKYIYIYYKISMYKLNEHSEYLLGIILFDVLEDIDKNTGIKPRRIAAKIRQHSPHANNKQIKYAHLLQNCK